MIKETFALLAPSKQLLIQNLAGARITHAQEEHWQIISHIKEKEVDALILLARQHNQSAFDSYQALIQEQQEVNHDPQKPAST